MVRSLLTDKGNAPNAVALARQQFVELDVFALGFPAGDTSTPGEGTESDLLYFTIDDINGEKRIMLPVFTQLDTMKEALWRNPDWQSFDVLQVKGKALLENVDRDVIIVVDPWSPLEFQLPPRAD